MSDATGPCAERCFDRQENLRMYKTDNVDILKMTADVFLLLAYPLFYCHCRAGYINIIDCHQKHLCFRPVKIGQTFRYTRTLLIDFTTAYLPETNIETSSCRSLFCNNGTRFDQRTLTCRDEALALPCAESEEFYTSVKFFEKFDIFERARAEDEQRRTKILRRLETLEDVEALEAQLEK